MTDVNDISTTWLTNNASVTCQWLFYWYQYICINNGSIFQNNITYNTTWVKQVRCFLKIVWEWSTQFTYHQTGGDGVFNILQKNIDLTLSNWHYISLHVHYVGRIFLVLYGVNKWPMYQMKSKAIGIIIVIEMYRKRQNDILRAVLIFFIIDFQRSKGGFMFC